MLIDPDKSHPRTLTTSNEPDKKKLDKGSMKTTRAMSPRLPHSASAPPPERRFGHGMAQSPTHPWDRLSQGPVKVTLAGPTQGPCQHRRSAGPVRAHRPCPHVLSPRTGLAWLADRAPCPIRRQHRFPEFPPQPAPCPTAIRACGRLPCFLRGAKARTDP